MDNRKKIVIPYCPTDLWRNTIHPGLDAHRFSVVVAHRRFGKTVGLVNQTIKRAVQNDLRSPVYAYIAPYLKQAKQNAWNYIKYYTSVIPGVRVNESDLSIEFPSRFKGADGAKIKLFGADNPDALRGSYFDGIIMDEPAQMRPNLYQEILRPAISDRNGWAVWIGTPKGQNAFYEVWQRAQKEHDWYDCKYDCYESGLFDEGGRYGPQELEDIKKQLNDETFRQEYLCDFTASAGNVLIPIDIVVAAAEKDILPQDIEGAPVILGADVARFGGDRCTIFRRQGLCAFKPEVYQDIDNMTFAGHLIRAINKYKPDAVFVDAGRGEGVIDRCRQLGYEITEVNFGARASEPNHYVNKRTEMWDDCREWLEAGGSIPDDSVLKAELSAPEYRYDAANRMVLEKKEEIKEKIGRSPDLADGLVLTFAEPVLPRSALKDRRLSRCDTDYNPI